MHGYERACLDPGPWTLGPYEDPFVELFLCLAKGPQTHFHLHTQFGREGDAHVQYTHVPSWVPTCQPANQLLAALSVPTGYRMSGSVIPVSFGLDSSFGVALALLTDSHSLSCSHSLAPFHHRQPNCSLHSRSLSPVDRLASTALRQRCLSSGGKRSSSSSRWF